MGVSKKTMQDGFEAVTTHLLRWWRTPTVSILGPGVMLVLGDGERETQGADGGRGNWKDDAGRDSVPCSQLGQ